VFKRTPNSLRLRPNYSKPIQTQPSKSKQKPLDLLGFIRPKRGFSKAYGDPSAGLDPSREVGLDPATQKHSSVAQIPLLGKEFLIVRHSQSTLPPTGTAGHRRRIGSTGIHHDSLPFYSIGDMYFFEFYMKYRLALSC